MIESRLLALRRWPEFGNQKLRPSGAGSGQHTAAHDFTCGAVAGKVCNNRLLMLPAGWLFAGHPSGHQTCPRPSYFSLTGPECVTCTSTAWQNLKKKKEKEEPLWRKIQYNSHVTMAKCSTVTTRWEVCTFSNKATADSPVSAWASAHEGHNAVKSLAASCNPNLD